MYLLVLKKTQNDKAPFPIEKALQAYFKKRSDDVILISPGYMSNTANTIQNFFQDFQRITNLKNNIVIFANGMNGGQVLKHSSVTILDEHYNYLTNKYSPFSVKRDHSKFLIFVEDDLTAGNSTAIKNITSDIIGRIILNKSKVVAILLGSSNFSYTTYFNSPTHKGEADIFMISEDVFSDGEIVEVVNQLRDSDLNDGEIILSKEMDSRQNLNLIAKKLLKE